MSQSTTPQGRPRSLYYQRKMGARKQDPSLPSQPEHQFGSDVVKLEPNQPVCAASDHSHQTFIPEHNQKPAVDSALYPETLSHPVAADISDILQDLKNTTPSLANHTVETEKLEWMKNLNEPSKAPAETVSVEKGKLFEARFDTEGQILSPDSQIPVSRGLYHHGQDPDKPGYTLDEILILLQSSSQSQKLWALGILTAIFRKAKAAVYDEYLDESILKRISEEGMVLPLRYLLDCPSLPVVTASILALRALLVSDADEFLTEYVLIWGKNPLLFELVPETPTSDKDTDEKDLPDAQLIKIDLIKGLLRTSILRRFSYLLHTYVSEMDSTMVNCLFAILIRISRHSGEIAQQVADDTDLMQLLMDKTVTGKAPVAQMRFLRILTWILGPLPGKATERIYNSAAGWISALRTDIEDITTRDMVTESLNLLIMIANYGQITLNALSIVDVFPQVLYSAGPKKTGTVATAWDARCCSQMLVLLSLCLRTDFKSTHVLDEALVEKTTQNVMDAYVMLKEAAISIPNKHIVQLESSYLQYLAEYIKQQRPMSRNIVLLLRSRLSEALADCLNFTEIFQRNEFKVSRCNPDCLQSYGLLAHGGNSVHPVFVHPERLNYSESVLHCLSLPSLGNALNSAQIALINKRLKQVPTYSQNTDDFWSYRYVRPLLELALFAHSLLRDGNLIDKKLLYCAALHLVPLLIQNQQEQLRSILTEIIFNADLLRNTSWLIDASSIIRPVVNESALSNMVTVRLAFMDLRPLGFPDNNQLASLVLPSRDAHVFSTFWMFDCFSYLCSWIAQQSAARNIRRESFVREYFAWIVVMVNALVHCGRKTFLPSDMYLTLASYFNADDDIYRDELVGASLRIVLKIMTESPGFRGFDLKPADRFRGRTLDDVFGDILDDYLGSSYGDPTFTNYVLLYVTQLEDIAFRKKFWGPEKQAWSAVRMPSQLLSYPVSLHLEPAEMDINLLNQYLRLLLNRQISQQQHPLMFLIAIHHINRFMKNQSNLDAETQKFRNGLLSLLSRMKEDILVQQILQYSGPASNAVDVIGVFETIPDDVIQIFRSL
ncbi:uncharacterized protein LOC129588258 isoform X2 [Paramacrobiotus metropolitanus]|uniref:uncharacterized protein LOC129588258 isoform X2 n=1 Tax=Paramacrobiotus metropolitanus TaxID=2943436 RepID=UPI002445B739|nr:uncharacterized protein LOC129588258 isoform X2 [Paramacrobiotus metropolitanus]